MVVGEPSTDRRSRRHAQSKAEILDEAWRLIAANGVAGLSMGDLGRAVGMRPQSLYSYFGSKHDIYDALFAQGFAALVAEREAMTLPDDPEEALRQGCRAFVDFCVTDPARCQLLFQRSVPGFEPSAASLALASRALAHLEQWVRAAGIDDPAGVDLLRALLIGIAGEQVANEPGGDRWTRLVDRTLNGYLAEMRSAPERQPARGRDRA